MTDRNRTPYIPPGKTTPASNSRDGEVRYRLIGEVCPGCERRIFPPRDLCPDPECGVRIIPEGDSLEKMILREGVSSPVGGIERKG